MESNGPLKSCWLISPKCRIYASVNRFSIGSDNGLSPTRCQAIIWTKWSLSIEPLGTNFREFLIKIQNFSFTKMHLKISSAKWRPFCPGGDESSVPQWHPRWRVPPILPLLVKCTVDIPSIKNRFLWPSCPVNNNHTLYNIPHTFWQMFRRCNLKSVNNGYHNVLFPVTFQKQLMRIPCKLILCILINTYNVIK